jgi:cytochrome c biogenesis protein CcmG/thiol:disulfide interchange protein DsbE
MYREMGIGMTTQTGSDQDQVLVAAEKRGISPREALYGVVGVLVGVLILGSVWMRAGRSTAPLPTLTEVPPYGAPVFTLRNLAGAPVSLSDFKGKVVLVNFWATWCQPCKEETPELEAVYQQLRDEGLVIIGVDLFKTERPQERGLEDVRNFMIRYAVSYPIVLDETGRVAQDYAIAPIPTSYFIDQQGKVRFIRVGKVRRSDVEHVFRRLQAEQELREGTYQPATDMATAI